MIQLWPIAYAWWNGVVAVSLYTLADVDEWRLKGCGWLVKMAR